MTNTVASISSSLAALALKEHLEKGGTLTLDSDIFPQPFTVTYYDCGHGHKHTSYATALKCIEGHTRVKPEGKFWAISRVLDGITLRKIGEEQGLSMGRISQIFKLQATDLYFKASRYGKYDLHAFENLSVRKARRYADRIKEVIEA